MQLFKHRGLLRMDNLKDDISPLTFTNNYRYPLDSRILNYNHIYTPHVNTPELG